MSFTTNIKNEMLNLEYPETEIIAELSAIINISAEIKKESFEIYTENIGVSRRIYTLIKNLFNQKIEITTQEINRLNKNYIVNISVEDKDKKILKTLNIIDENNKRRYIPEDYITDNLEEKKAYLRGAFLICGSVNDPKTSRYHLEFIIDNKKVANFINKLLNDLNFSSKVLKRERHYMVYIKESEKISDFIKLLNAYNSLFYYEDIRIYRDHKNMTNRLNNCEQANMDKIFLTANKQLKDIKIIEDNGLMEMLDSKLREAVSYRTKYPESSLAELADIMSKELGYSISKSGLNHRFRKLRNLAEQINNN